jgi:hypothetical protein
MSAAKKLTIFPHSPPAVVAGPLPLAITSPKFAITPTGLEIRGELSLEEWTSLGEKLGDVERCLGFIIGDWINYAESKWGDKYNDAIAATGLEYALLRKYAYVARRVPPANRLENMPFSHHETVAKEKDLQKQREWLLLAEKHDLGVRRLRKSMNYGRLATEAEVQGDPNDRGIVTHLALINRLARWWKHAMAEDRIENWDEEDRKILAQDFSVINRIYEKIRSSLDETTKREIDRYKTPWKI